MTIKPTPKEFSNELPKEFKNKLYGTILKQLITEHKMISEDGDLKLSKQGVTDYLLCLKEPDSQKEEEGIYLYFAILRNEMAYDSSSLQESLRNLELEEGVSGDTNISWPLGINYNTFVFESSPEFRKKINGQFKNRPDYAVLEEFSAITNPNQQERPSVKNYILLRGGGLKKTEVNTGMNIEEISLLLDEANTSKTTPSDQ